MHDNDEMAQYAAGDPDARHECPDPTCPVAGVRIGDLPQLGYAMSVFYHDGIDGGPTRDDLDTVVFTDATGLHVLITLDCGTAGTAVIGALYTPDLYKKLRESGYTTRSSEKPPEVN